jgi:hypothetical protein
MSGHAGTQQPVIRAERAPALLDKDTASGLSTIGTGVDMAGYDRVAFDIQIGTAVSGAVFDAWVVESNESNLGNATNVNFANNSSAQIKLTQTTASANQNNTVKTLEVYRPAKRYVGVTLKTATQNITLVSVISRKYRGTGVIPATVSTDHQYVAGQAYTA